MIQMKNEGVREMLDNGTPLNVFTYMLEISLDQVREALIENYTLTATRLLQQQQQQRSRQNVSYVRTVRQPDKIIRKTAGFEVEDERKGVQPVQGKVTAAQVTAESVTRISKRRQSVKVPHIKGIEHAKGLLNTSGVSKISKNGKQARPTSVVPCRRTYNSISGSPPPKQKLQRNASWHLDIGNGNCARRTAGCEQSVGAVSPPKQTTSRRRTLTSDAYNRLSSMCTPRIKSNCFSFGHTSPRPRATQTPNTGYRIGAFTGRAPSELITPEVYSCPSTPCLSRGQDAASCVQSIQRGLEAAESREALGIGRNRSRLSSVRTTEGLTYETLLRERAELNNVSQRGRYMQHNSNSTRQPGVRSTLGFGSCSNYSGGAWRSSRVEEFGSAPPSVLFGLESGDAGSTACDGMWAGSECRPHSIQNRSLGLVGENRSTLTGKFDWPIGHAARMSRTYSPVNPRRLTAGINGTEEALASRRSSPSRRSERQQRVESPLPIAQDPREFICEHFSTCDINTALKCVRMKSKTEVRCETDETEVGGTLREGDVLLECNEQPLASVIALQRIVADTLAAGLTAVSLRVLRGSESVLVRETLVQ
uniref:Uncharacterized protein n=1 Tax=Trypanosoma vivax (strain Y486) TaxID=1055687 RepID=G0TRH7_TRYVY|nr:conserved hypothetical protein [Trypanosoma vivax Y486]